MTVLVAYDGQELSDGALARARTCADALDEDLETDGDVTATVENCPRDSRIRGPCERPG